jgi:penicillin-binding protein 1A
MRKVPHAFRALLLTVVIGGVAVGACLAALIPGAETLVSSSHFTSDKLGKLRGLAQRSTVFDSKGNVLAQLGIINREDVKLEFVPKILQDAVISVEDKTFWHNDGVDINGVLRAALKNLTSGSIEQGGSTITQQLVKNRILTSKRDINRKIREVVLAIRLNDKYSKREILEQYLNTVYFGQGSYGVKSAVERLFLTPGGPFGSTPTELANITVGEAAMLAGLISNPEGNNPFVHPDRAKERRSFALHRMEDQHYITAEQVAAGEAEPLPTVKPEAELRPKTSWAEEVQDRLFTDPLYAALGKTEKERKDAVLRGGLKITATLDPDMQAKAQDAMDRILPEKPGFTGSLVAMDPTTGFVKAMVAGPGFESSQYNIATSYPGRQAGSTWKVITLAAALESGFSPNDIVDGTSPCKFGTYGQTSNSGEGENGAMTLRQATADSVNCAFARTELATGFDKVIATATKMGITQKTLKPILTLTLGTVETAPLEMATVAATLANGGIHHAATFVSKIVDPNGEVVFDATKIPGDRAISADTAACETSMLRGVVTGGTGTAANISGHTIVGKTGTTDSKADANFLGYMPGQLAAFIWHGNATARVPGAGFGGEIPARIFHAFMQDALTGPDTPLPAPGPSCARAAQFITENGRVATFMGLLPGQLGSTTVPASIIVNTTNPVVTVPTILPTTTPTTQPCPKGAINPNPPPAICP